MQETDIHVLSGIQTRDINNQAAAELRLIPHGDRDRYSIRYRALNTTSVANIIYSPIFETINEFTFSMVRLSLFCMKDLYDCQHLVNSRTDN
jgi:hypothetical protein